MNTSDSTHKFAALLRITSSALVVLALSGCAGYAATSASPSDSPAPEAAPVSETTTPATDSFVVETDTYSLALPAEWAELAEVSYEDDQANVHLKGRNDLPLLSIELVDGSTMLTSGDIGCGCFYNTDLQDGRRLEAWSTNWLWILAQESSSGNGTHNNLDDATKQALIKLTYGKEVDLADLPQIYEHYSEGNYLMDYYAHMEDLVTTGLTLH